MRLSVAAPPDRALEPERFKFPWTVWRDGVMKGLECVKIDFLPKLMKK